MRGTQSFQGAMFPYLSLEERDVTHISADRRPS